MFSVHEFEQHNINFAWSQYFRENLTPEDFHVMQSGRDVGDIPAYEHLFRNPACVFYEEREIFNVKRLEDLHHSNVRDITRRLGFYTRCGASLNKTGPWIDGFFCQHKTEAEVSGLIGDERLELILPIMANSVSLGRSFQALRSRFQAALSVLDAWGVGVFLVDATGCVVEHNKEAQHILDAKDGLELSKGKRLKLNSPDSTKELENMIVSANGLLLGELDVANSLLAADRPSELYDYLISVSPLEDNEGELEVGLKCAFVTVIDPNRKNALSAAGVTKLGQLTEGESQVVSLLIKGFRPLDVADQRNVSLNTVKTQLKSISQKLRCSTQADIIRIAAATNMPIEHDHPNE